MQCVYLHVKHALNNIQGTHNVSSQGSIAIDVPTETFWKEKKLNISEVKHNGVDDWEVRLIDQTDDVEDLRKTESFWQHEMDTFQPNGLNEREVALFWYLTLAHFL